MTTGERIKAARKNAGLTQEELGKRLGVSYVGISQWENNIRNPKYITLQRIANALGITPQELIGDGSNIDIADFVNTVCYGEGITTPSAEERISAALEKLNHTGQNVAVERVEELTKIPDYQK